MVTYLNPGSFSIYQYFTGCFLNELWNLPAADATFLSNVSLLNDSAARYPSCDNNSVGSVVLDNTTLNTATVAYYTGTTPNSTACFVCDESSGYKLNTTISTERMCQNDGRWSRTPVVCGMLQSFGMYYIYRIFQPPQNLVSSNLSLHQETVSKYA